MVLVSGTRSGCCVSCSQAMRERADNIKASRSCGVQDDEQHRTFLNIRSFLELVEISCLSATDTSSKGLSCEFLYPRIFLESVDTMRFNFRYVQLELCQFRARCCVSS